MVKTKSVAHLGPKLQAFEVRQFVLKALTQQSGIFFQNQKFENAITSLIFKLQKQMIPF